MNLHFYNTRTRQRQVFEPIKAGRVGLYTCGPTVYWFAHIGNLRAYLFADVLRRTFELNGFDVTHIMNITDVGHLVGDGDEGEDKLEVGSKRDGKTAWEIAEFYTQAFLKDSERLNILPATKYTNATDHIPEQIAMIEALEKNGYTYKTSDGIYFDTSKLESYGRLGGQKAEEKEAGVRVEMGEKKNTTDFALWKFSPKGEQRQMEWDSPWGIGFPGWHIECSAMSTKYLGRTFDIHTGGVDHIAVHHENELAQTRGAYDTLQANFWMHSEFLTVDGGKMSKSLGNLFTLDDLAQKGFEPLAYRYLVLGAHYRSKLNFTCEALWAAQNALHRLRSIVREWDEPDDVGCAEFENDFLAAVNDDLNTPQALSFVWKLVDDKELPTKAKSRTLLFFDRILGLRLDDVIGKPLIIPAEVQALIKARDAARTKKDWKTSDTLRDEIISHGFSVMDTSEGTKVR
ncbi:cysteine--tRNA ligase [Candidatus Uhrbacteria bacterium RIFCSPHIGHO2_02_FULL_54_11]|nr:MAG: cysteine--tRNA ligase [Candidatus Uhrbacteria bacterium RIFCSPHIGHO2_02_FULL_54_11]